jgi:trk system potassium uptake protein TrkH
MAAILLNPGALCNRRCMCDFLRGLVRVCRGEPKGSPGSRVRVYNAPPGRAVGAPASVIAMRKPVGYGLIPYRFLGATEVFVFSFAVAILVGALALMLPSSTVSGNIRFIDALFTSTSAVCVTGLTVLDTATYFTRSGQFIIMCLIQLGGLGIMTFSIVLLILSGRRLSLRDKMILQDAFVPAPIVEVPSLVRRLFLSTLAIEGLGAAALYLFTPDRTVFAAVFHSVSAFCNAGFALKSTNFMAYRYNAGVNLTICCLIVLGGLGFFTHIDLARRLGRKGKSRISTHSRLVLTVTAALITAGAFGFYVFETGNILAGDDFADVFLASLFQSVTARTAGFNTVDFGHLANATLFWIILLMFIGASPGSTGGGIKTTTFGILLAMAKSRYRGQDNVSVYKRTVPDETVSKALFILILAFLLVTVATLVLAATETGDEPYLRSETRFIEVMFEVVSAFGTVGLSTGLTPRLSGLGKFILVLVMFVGRVGPLSIAALVGQQKGTARYRYAEENVMVG